MIFSLAALSFYPLYGSDMHLIRSLPNTKNLPGTIIRRTWFAIYLLSLLLLVNCSSPLNRKEGIAELHKAWSEFLEGTKHTDNAQLYIVAPGVGISEIFNPATAPAAPFHAASVGKLFTAVMIGQLIEEGKLDWQTKISTVLKPGSLDRLFIVSGKDYTSQVTILQLLEHTSGVADYFSDRPANGGGTAAELMLKYPQRRWSPDDLLNFNRKHLQALAEPGKTFHYSDTGYVLLGLVIEKITGRSFHQNLSQRIFTPLQMKDSYMPGRSRPANKNAKPLGRTWFQGVEVSSFPSITVDWAGGGVVTTLEDLMKFNRSLFEDRLLRPSTMKVLAQFDHTFKTGMHYGRGMMEYHFDEFFPLLRGYPLWRGHLGILSTHALYDPERRIFLVMNLASDEHLEDGFRLLIKISDILRRIK